MLSDQVTVCIFAFNEENRLERCVRNFIGKFPILVVDNFSLDKTRDVAERLGVSVASIRNPGFVHTPEVMDRVYELVKTPYILIASVSEYVPLTLLKKYADIADAGQYDVVRTYRESITAGHAVRFEGGPDRNAGVKAFFRVGAMDYVGNLMHGNGRVACSAERFLSLADKPEYHSFHFRDYDCGKIERTIVNYDDVLALQYFQAGKKFSFLGAFARASKGFIEFYFLGGAWRYGTFGFLHSYYRFHMTLSIWLRVWEWETKHDLANVRRRNEAWRLRLEQQDGIVSGDAHD